MEEMSGSDLNSSVRVSRPIVISIDDDDDDDVDDDNDGENIATITNEENEPSPHLLPLSDSKSRRQEPPCVIDVEDDDPDSSLPPSRVGVTRIDLTSNRERNSTGSSIGSSRSDHSSSSSSSSCSCSCSSSSSSSSLMHSTPLSWPEEEALRPEDEPVRDEDSPSKPALCGICYSEVKIVGRIDCCVHEFCCLCIEEWSKRSNTCPVCRERFHVITPMSVSRDRDARVVGEPIMISDRNLRVESNPFSMGLAGNDIASFLFSNIFGRFMHRDASEPIQMNTVPNAMDSGRSDGESVSPVRRRRRVVQIVSRSSPRRERVSTTRAIPVFLQSSRFRRESPFEPIAGTFDPLSMLLPIHRSSASPIENAAPRNMPTFFRYSPPSSPPHNNVFSLPRSSEVNSAQMSGNQIGSSQHPIDIE